MGDSIFDPLAVPPSLVELLPMLRAAKEVEPHNLRAAYLCRFYVYEYAHRLDPTSSGRGVRQFKNAILQTLERENILTLEWRRENSDAREMQQFYLYYCDMFIQRSQNAVEKADRDLLTKSYQTEAVLFEVLKAVNVSQRVEEEILETHRKIEEKRELCAPYNMLPVDAENTAQPMGDSIFDPLTVPPSLVDLLPILLVAKEVEPGNFRVAYLCRFYVYEYAHRLDPTSSGRGVRQFKNAILQTLERENSLTLKWRRENSDVREMQQFYLYYCEMFIQRSQNAVEEADRDLLTKSYQTEAVLFEVLKAVNVSQRVEEEILETHRKIEEKRELCAPYNMLPVDAENTAQPMGDSTFDPLTVPPSLVDLLPILRVAKEVEPGNFRVAYLCRFYVYEYAHRLDPTSSGRGVRQFKNAILQTLERENILTLKWRRENSDAREMQQFYLYYCEMFIQRSQNAVEEADRDLLTKSYQTEAVLFEVLKAVNVSQRVEEEILETHHKIEEKRELCGPYNMLPVDAENTAQPMGDSIFDPLTVPPSLVDLLPILRVAKEVEPGNFRVAYLCRFYVYEYAHRLDPTSSGRGVRQFKNTILQTLERENILTLKWRRENSDAREMQQFYLYYCEMFIQRPQNAVEEADRDLLTKSYQTEAVLFEVLKAVNVSQRVEVDQEILETHRKIEEKRELCAPYNMLPVDAENTAQPIREHPEAHLDYCNNKNIPEEISDSEGQNDSSASDKKGLIAVSRDRMDIKCMTPNVLDQIIHKASVEPISIPLALLQDITDNFSDERKIGQGGFAVVYKGVLQNGYVAVKKLLSSQTIDDRLFYHEINFLMSVKHQNIVRFLGYCANTENIAIKVDGTGKCEKYMYPEMRERLLCFEYISKGSLHNHLTDELRGLEWHTRYRTIKGICEGLQYLHKEKDIVHMDLKPDNILMDDLMIPKITDFGISKHLDGISQAVTGGRHVSLGYCAPEYLHRGQVSFKSDIFSLGVIIIDLVTGRKGDPDIKNVLRRWRYRWNRSATYPPLGYQQVTECVEIAARCVSHDPKTRPYISDIIRQLNEMESTNGQVNNANEPTFSLISPYPWELLDIDPLELHFPFEVDKQIPCSLQLSNPRDDCIAFYVQTSSGQYLIEPNKGIVPPQSKSNVIITFRAQKMAPHRMMYKDEFIVRCTMVNEDLTTENVTEDMFDEESKVVDNVSLTVAF